MSWGEAASAIGGGLNLLGGATKAGGQNIAGQTAYAQEQYQASQQDYAAQVSDYQAAVAENNAKAAEEIGARTVAGGVTNATVEGEKSAATVGKMKANQAANNVDVNTGSAVETRADAAAAGVFNEENVLANAQLSNWGYRVSASNFRTQSALDTSQANLLRSNAAFARSMAPYALQGGQLAAGGTLLSSASSLPWSWIGDKVGGIFGGGQLSTPGGNTGAQGAIQAGGGLIPDYGGAASAASGASAAAGASSFADVGELLSFLAL